MNLFKKILTTIFIVISLILLVYISQILFIKSQRDVPARFTDTQSTRYVNYYLNRADFKFSLNNEQLLIEKDGKFATFQKDNLVDLFLNEWTSYEEKLYPSKECKFVRISIPNDQKSISEGNIVFSCVDAIETDTFNNLAL